MVARVAGRRLQGKSLQRRNDRAPLASIIDLIVLAESLGYKSAWIADGPGGGQRAVPAA